MCVRTRLGLLVCAAGLGVGVTCVWSAAGLAGAPAYRVVDLGAGWSGSGLNEHGDACGNISPDGQALLAGVSRDGQPFEYLPLPAGMQSSSAHDINDEGVIVGAVCPNQFVITQPIAAVWRPIGDGYEVEVLGTYSSDPYSRAWSINNLGDIIGGSGHFGWSLTTGLHFADTGPQPLPGLASVSAINDLRVMVSNNQLIDLETGAIETIPLPAGIWQGFAGNSLNNNNDVCGHVIGYSGCSTFPVRYRHGIGWEFLGGCGTITSATSINDGGDALLYFYSTAAGVHFADLGYFGLGSLIDASQGPWIVQPGGVTEINNTRQILSSARRGISGPIGAILLVPISPFCAADVDGSGAVDFADLNIILSNWGATGVALGEGDVTGEGDVNFDDLNAVMSAWNAACD